MTGLHHVSLFAGVGGADLGMEAAGIPTVAAVEIDDQARGVLAHRFPHARLFRDVNEVTGDDLRDAGAVPDRTVLSGGFPCQPFSVAGRRKGVDDERGELFWQIDRILSEFPARWLLLENVPGLLSIDSGRTMGTILRDLGERGYGVAYRVLDAQFFGVPQRRRRVFIVGRLGDDRGPVQVLLEPEGGGGDSAAGGSEGAGTAETVDGSPDGVGSYSMTGVGWWNADEDGVTSTLAARESNARLVVSALASNMAGAGGGVDDNTAQAGHLVPYVKVVRSGARDDDGNLPPEVWDERTTAPTLNVNDNGGESRATVLAVTGFSHSAQGTTVRRLTPVEWERLMGWPDGHTANRVDFKTGKTIPQADSPRYRQCGNGMAAPVVAWIARRILAVES